MSPLGAGDEQDVGRFEVASQRAVGLDVPAGQGLREAAGVVDRPDRLAGEGLGEPVVQVAACGFLARRHPIDPDPGGCDRVGGVVLGQLDAAARRTGVVDAVASVVVQGNVDGVGGQVETVHDPGPGCLEVAVGVGLLVGDLGAVAAHQSRGVEQGLGYLVDAGVGRSLAWPGRPAGQAGLDGRGLRRQAGDGPIALVDARPATR